MEQPKTMPIAVIGMSCRFSSDASSPEKLWNLVAEARSGWSEFPKNRFNGDSFYHPTSEKIGNTQVRGAHFIDEDVGLFDASFFNFSVEIASTMDPQIRLQLESAFEAIESAGLNIDKLAGSDTAVFAGEFVKDYYDSLMRDPETVPRFYVTGNGVAMMSARISHFFDLRGPCLTLDTGCSTSLVALHQACQSIRSGEASMSIVSGSNLLLNPDMFNQMSAMGLLSKEGRSFSFDSRGTGYGRGEGVATIIIKPLADAIRDNDPIRAVIRETAINQDGKTPTITSPSMEAQIDLMRACYKRAGLNPLETPYVEAHGTGTRTGDPIEVNAIHTALGGKRPQDLPLYIGSVKSNIGHTEAASGLAGLIKVVMAFEKGFIPPNYDFQNANASIPFDKFNMKVPTKLTPWPEHLPRRASVNSFGYGGTNVHVVLEDYTPAPMTLGGEAERTVVQVESNSIGSRKVFKLSSKDEKTTKRMITDLKDYLLKTEVSDEGELLHSLAYTLSQRRSMFTWTAATTAQTRSELIKALEPADMPPVRSDNKPRLGFVFTGQGAQWYAMGRELINVYPVFREAILEAEEILKDLGCPWSASEELTKPAETSRVNEVMLSLPLCIVVQLALVRLLRSWGINPAAVTGHSSGEVGAAFAANAIDMTEAIAIVWSRGTLTEEFQKKVQQKGGMIAVGMGREEAQPLLDSLTSGKAVIACVNSPSSVTLSGDLTAIVELEAKLKPTTTFTRRLKVDAAYHSHHMEVFAEYYRDYLLARMTNSGDMAGVVFSSPTTGDRIDKVLELGPDHWVKNMVQPVEFVDSFTNMCIDTRLPPSDPARKTVDIVVEIGPHGALAGPIRQILQTPELKSLNLAYGTALTRGQDAVLTMQKLASLLVSRGYPVDLQSVNNPSGVVQAKTLHSLPSYPWNHQTRYWFEPRLNREYRLREFPEHDLLGVRIPANNPDAPVWRHIIRQSEIPWVKDHQVQSTVIYPAAGYICMAIQGMRELLASERAQILGYSLRDIKIDTALLVPEDNTGIEVQLQLRSCRNDKRVGYERWFEFVVSSVTMTDDWTEHCRGFIAIEAASKPSVESLPSKKTFHGKRKVQPQRVFESLHELGVQHGSAFQNLVAIETDHDQSLASFKICDTASLMPEKYECNHVIHPTTLDSIIVAAFTALPGGIEDQKVGMVPSTIASLFVSTQIPTKPGVLLDTHTSCTSFNSRGFSSSSTTTAQSEETESPLVELTGLYFKSLGDAQVMHDEEGDKLCSTVAWDIDVDHLGPDELKSLVGITQLPAQPQQLDDLKLSAFFFIRKALEELTEADVSCLDGHHRKFYNWMMQQNKLAKMNKLSEQSLDWLLASDEERIQLIESVRNQDFTSKMLCIIGEKIVAILRKEVMPLELMLDGGLLYDFYEKDIRVQESHRQLQKYLAAYTHKNPRASICEIGAGAGGCTQAVLEALGGGSTGRKQQFSHYDFTDVTAGFFSNAKDRFSAWGDSMGYKRLDIEVDVAEQSFKQGSYDIVVACRVLHATKVMSKTLENVRKLLKPGGKLIIIEDTVDSLDHQVIYGVLPGWWLGEEEDRKQSPTMPVTSWESLLRRSGFRGLDFDIPCYEEELYQSSSLIVSTAIPAAPAAYGQETMLVSVGTTPSASSSWIASLASSIETECGSKVTAVSLGSADLAGKVCIFLEMDRPELTNPTAATYEALQKMLIGAKAVMWVTRGAQIDAKNPFMALSSGLLRTLRCEDRDKRYILLDLDSTRNNWTAEDLTTITKIYKTTLNLASEQSAMESEYSERAGTILIPRVTSAPQMDAITNTNSTSPASETQHFKKRGRELQLATIKPGSLDGLVFSQEYAADDSLPPQFVEIEPWAIGVNYRDVEVALGKFDDDETFGYEVSGFVTRVGSGVTSLLVGQRVCALTNGGFSTHVRVHSSCVAAIPDALEFDVAATMPVAFVSAYASLYEYGRLRKGDKVLIHHASRDIGQAAVMLAQLAGAEIFATASTPEKRTFLAKTYGIPETHLFSSNDAAFASHIKRITSGKGVDVVVSSVSRDLLQESWNCIAQFGRFCQISGTDVAENNSLAMGPFGRMASFTTMDPMKLAEHHDGRIHQMLNDVISLINVKALSNIVPIKRYAISQLREAFDALRSDQFIGKVVVTADHKDEVKVIVQPRPVKLDESLSYLIVGGMGGIGQSISKRLVERGARNLILISRSAEKQVKSAQAFLGELKASGCRVSVRSCDVTSASDLSRVVSECERDMPRIGGVIQAAMVLRDTIFDQMSYADYMAAVRPKVNGTWNLHKEFASRQLSFFVVLSSFVGVGGNGGQANYAAGGAFEDAVARCRSANSLPAVTIDLGAVKEIGYLVEHAHVADRLAKLGYKALSEQEVLDLVEAGIREPMRSITTSQIVTGISGGDWGNAPWAEDPRFSAVKPAGSSNASDSQASGPADLKTLMLSATTPEEIAEAIQISLVKKVSEMFSLAEEDIDPAGPLSRYGVDSLVAVELRNWLRSSTKADVSIFDLTQSPSLAVVASKVAAKSQSA
ncbi:reducing type I polyketide synthase [Xylaria palmicola]|nr:reducing type I polyketide synthase [Xylaria palmicola]